VHNNCRKTNFIDKPKIGTRIHTSLRYMLAFTKEEEEEEEEKEEEEE